ncbi:hypothetical protein [Flavobacterium sp.]|jgi:peroxiredoxin|uniref:hypothetical protein n=1 Tax=Flavobacterium sp. TaxID=239 RepID=UPI0035AF9598
MKPFKLDEQKIESGFKVPDGYFEKLTSDINAKLATNEPKVVSIFSRKKVIYYAVAAVLVLALSIPLFNYYNSTTSLTQEEVEDYIALQSGITEDDLVNALDKEDIEKLKIDLKIEDKVLEETLVNELNIEEYITD